MHPISKVGTLLSSNILRGNVKATGPYEGGDFRECNIIQVDWTPCIYLDKIIFRLAVRIVHCSSIEFTLCDHRWRCSRVIHFDIKLCGLTQHNNEFHEKLLSN